MKDMLYDLPEKDTLVLPDVTLLLIDNPAKANFVLRHRDDVIFPETTDSLTAALELKDVLKEWQTLANGDQDFQPSLEPVKRFGIHPGTEEAVLYVLGNYVDWCRRKHTAGEGFGPGVQYCFVGMSDDGLEHVLGNYGVMFGSLMSAAEDKNFRKFLMNTGHQCLGSRSALFNNATATNASITSLFDMERVFSLRGPTAEYAHMLHWAAAGHH